MAESPQPPQPPKPLKHKILEYFNLFAPEQLGKFERFYKLVSAPEVAKHYLLLLIMCTKSDIFIGTGKFNNKDNKNIKKLTTTFKKVITTLNTVEFNEVENFIEHVGNTERRILNDYVEEIAKTIIYYKNSKAALLGDDLLVIRDSVSRCMNSLLNKLNLIEGIYSDYKKAPRRDTPSAVLEGEKLAFERTAIIYKVDRSLCFVLAFVVVACLLTWGMILVTDLLDFYSDDMDEINYYVLASSILGKIIITTTLFFILTACLRVYYALRHNEMICRHRIDVLSCYEALYSTEEEKKFVLAKVTEAVFTQLPTGFSKLQSDEGKSGISLESLVSLLTRQGGSSG